MFQSPESAPSFPAIRELSDLSDGVGLAALLALYRPDELRWAEMALGSTPSMADSLFNLQVNMDAINAVDLVIPQCFMLNQSEYE